MSVHIKDKLVAEAVGAYGGIADWAIYLGKQPSAPHRCITLYDSGGQNPEPTLLLSYPSVQVRVRGGPADYIAARDKLQLIQDILLGIPSFDALDASGDRIDGIISIGDIAFLGYDETQRPEHVWNCRAFFEPATNAVTNRMSL